MTVSKNGPRPRKTAAKKAPAAPSKLPETAEEHADAAYRAALSRATGALRISVPDEAERALYADSKVRYANACALAARLRAEWDELGCPALGIDIPAKLRKRGPGRPVGAVSAPDRAAGAPPRIVRVK